MATRMYSASVLFALLLGGCAVSTSPEALQGETGRTSYSVGYQVGSDFRNEGWSFDAELFLQGVRTALADKAPALSAEEMNRTLAQLKRQLVDRQQLGSQQADETFLANHAREEGVVVLSSGVHYRVLRTGDGPRPTRADSVTIRYTVRRAGTPPAAGPTDGPAKTYPLASALPGLQEALLQMPQGARWEIVLPSSAPRGGRGEALGGGVLIYELELLAVTSGVP